MYPVAFSDNGVSFLAGEATIESNLIDVYKEGKLVEGDYVAKPLWLALVYLGI